MIIDLSQSINSNIKLYPGSPSVYFLKWSKYSIDGYDSEAIFLSTHTGTHIDAPSHFIEGAEPIDNIDVNRFVMKNVHLLKIFKSSNQLITVEEIINSGIDIKENDSIIFSTGWEHNYKSDNYINANPGLSPEAAIYLSNKKINAVAIDSPSIDSAIESEFPVHKILLKNDIIIIENLCNLAQIDKPKFKLIAIPLKLLGASGSPVRALAII
ncbi:MAG TPA: cyclase family protein [Nitrososphaeraceae archaeon]|nr:cyclase family protein [Nitrososphaeraceae archaeon]